MFNSFYFNNRNSYDDFSLAALKDVEDATTKEIVENMQVDGRLRGTVTVKTGTFEDLIIKRKLKLLNMNDYYITKSKINTWLSDITDNTLYFDDFPERVYKVKNVTLKTPTRDSYFFSVFEIEFTCEPFMYDRRETFTEVTNNSIIENFGDYECEPAFVLNVNTTNTIQITIGNNTLTIENAQGDIYVDTSLFRVIQNGVAVRTAGDFPKLKKGDNKITWSGNINKFEIKPNIVWRA